MCYGFHPALEVLEGRAETRQLAFFDKLFEVQVAPRSDGFHYAKDDIPVLLSRDGRLEATVLRWDLIPRHYLKERNPSLKEVVAIKNSRRPAGGVPPSAIFNSYNARMETVAEKLSFKQSWKEGRRFAVPVLKYRERPDMELAPPEFRDAEFNIQPDEGHFLAGLWDEWKNDREESLLSGTVLTLSSAGNAKIEGIWHERAPVLLPADQVETWLSPQTSPEEARQLCTLIRSERIRIEKVMKKPAIKPDDGQLDLFG